MDIEKLRSICTEENLFLTEHASERMDQRGIFVDDVLFTIMNGIVIEDYPEDKPYPSCLVLCSNVNGRPIHVVVSTDDTMIFLITAYVPNPEKWNEDFTKRK